MVALCIRRATCVPAVALAILLGLAGCGDGDSGGDDTRSSPDQSTPSPSDRGSSTATAVDPLHECAELWNTADFDEVRSFLSAQHRQATAEDVADEPDVVVGHYQGEPFVFTSFLSEVTVPDGACVVVDVDGTTVDAKPENDGYAAALVHGEWFSAAAGADHPLAEHPLPVTEPQLVKLDCCYEDPALALP